MRISVVIPTFNRCDLVRQSLLYLAAQHPAPEIAVQVIVVDDGSNDGTRTMIEQVRPGYPYCLRYIFRPRDAQSCRGRARNLGIAVGSHAVWPKWEHLFSSSLSALQWVKPRLVRTLVTHHIAREPSRPGSAKPLTRPGRDGSRAKAYAVKSVRR